MLENGNKGRKIDLTRRNKTVSAYCNIIVKSGNNVAHKLTKMPKISHRNFLSLSALFACQQPLHSPQNWWSNFQDQL